MTYLDRERELRHEAQDALFHGLDPETTREDVKWLEEVLSNFTQYNGERVERITNTLGEVLHHTLTYHQQEL